MPQHWTTMFIIVTENVLKRTIALHIKWGMVK